MQHWLYQGLAEPPPAALAQAEVVTLDKWHQPAALPQRRRPGSALRFPLSALPLLVPEQLVDPVLLPALATPTIRARRTQLATWSIAPVFTPDDPANRLVSIEIVQTPRGQSRKRRADGGSVAPLLAPEQLVDPVVLLPLAQPLRGAPDASASRSFSVAPIYVEPTADIVALDWLAAPAQPRARSRRLPDTSAFGSPLSALEVPESITVDKWLPAIEQPKNRKLTHPARLEVFVDVAALDNVPLDRWYAPLAEPLHFPPLRPLGTSVEPEVANPPVAPLVSAGRVWIVNDRPTAWEATQRADGWVPNERRSTWEEPTS